MSSITEFNYLLSEAKHTDGTNRYTFTYPAYWRQSIYSGLKVGVRSIKMIPAPVYFKISHLDLCRNDKSGVIHTPIDIALPISPSTRIYELNSMFKEVIQRQLSVQTAINADDVVVEFIGNILCIYIDRTDDALWIDLTSTTANKDTLQMLHVDNLSKLSQEHVVYFTSSKEPSNPERLDSRGAEHFTPPHEGLSIEDAATEVKKIKSIKFSGIWDRDDLYVLSSLTDMSYNRYLGYTNTEFHPPKTYNIHNTDNTFWIELYDKCNRIPVELSSKSVLVLELVLLQQEPR